MKQFLVLLTLAAALLASGAAHAAQTAPGDDAARLAGHLSVGSGPGRARVDVLRQRLARTNIRLARRVGRLDGDRVTKRDRTRARELSLGVLRARNVTLRERLDKLERRERVKRRRAARRAARRAGLAPAATRAAVRAATAAPSAAPAPSSAPASAGLEAIAACESGGNPSAVGGGGTYRGKYQFDRGTWASVGGSGDPAAASEAEQDQRAAALYAQRGASAWPSCGR